MVNFKYQHVLKGTKHKISDGYCKNHGMLFFSLHFPSFFLKKKKTENEPVSQEAIS